MTKQPPKHNQSATQSGRLRQLDGLRGLAIILVIFTHVRLGPIFAVLPEPLSSLLSLLANNGGIGVSILFLLSGYLMMSLYPRVPSVLTFWQKRYTRIFPAFLAMTVVLALVRSGWQVLPWWVILLIWAVVIVFAGKIWELLRRSNHRLSLGKWLFKGFLVVQLTAVLGYILMQNVVPAAIFMQIWPAWAQQLVGWLVNATMSLPYGTYIAQLDGVYWSVCTEVTFYLLYPRLFLPLFLLVVKRKSWLLNGAALLSLWPLLYGLQQVARGILGLQLLQIHLAIFFVLGIAVSYFEQSDFGKKIKIWLQHQPPTVSGAVALAAIIASPLVWRLINVPPGINTMVWAVPLTVGFFLTLSINGWWRNILQTKLMVQLGTMSYALYLTHTLAIELMVRFGEPATLWGASAAMIASFIIVIPFATLVHFMLERPYMFDKAVEPKKVISTISNVPRFVLWLQNPRFITSVVALIVLALIWQANRVPVAPTALVQNDTSALLQRQTLLTFERVVTIPFVASQNNLGMVMVHLQPLSDAESAVLGAKKHGSETLAALKATIFAGDQLIHESQYPLYQIYQARFFMIGLPLQPDSKDVPYRLELSITDPLANTNLALVNQDATIRTIYFPSKQLYFKHPSLVWQMVWGKLIQPFVEYSGFMQLIYTLPALLILLIVAWQRRTEEVVLE